jgi:hypothetical protein
MVDTSTPHYAFVKPEIFGSPDTWGTKLNANMDAIDNILFTINQTGAANLPAQVAALPSMVPIGGIVMYYNDAAHAAALPPNWKVCDGTGGTPDLRDRNVIGAGLSWVAGTIAGNASFQPGIHVAAHQISIAEMPGHDHGYSQSPHGHSGGDSGHGHGASQDSHTHNMQGARLDAASGSGVAFGNGWAIGNKSTDGESAGGVYVGTGYANVVINPSNANINFVGQGGWQAHGHDGTWCDAVPLYSPFVVAYYIMRMS